MPDENLKVRDPEHDPEVEKLLKETGELIQGSLPKNVRFTLFLYEEGKDGLFFMSTASKESMVRALEGFVGEANGK